MSDVSDWAKRRILELYIAGVLVLTAASSFVG